MLCWSEPVQARRCLQRGLPIGTALAPPRAAPHVVQCKCLRIPVSTAELNDVLVLAAFPSPPPVYSCRWISMATDSVSPTGMITINDQ